MAKTSHSPQEQLGVNLKQANTEAAQPSAKKTRLKSQQGRILGGSSLSSPRCLERSENPCPEGVCTCEDDSPGGTWRTWSPSGSFSPAWVRGAGLAPPRVRPREPGDPDRRTPSLSHALGVCLDPLIPHNSEHPPWPCQTATSLCWPRGVGCGQQRRKPPAGLGPCGRKAALPENPYPQGNDTLPSFIDATKRQQARLPCCWHSQEHHPGELSAASKTSTWSKVQLEELGRGGPGLRLRTALHLHSQGGLDAVSFGTH